MNSSWKFSIKIDGPDFIGSKDRNNIKELVADIPNAIFRGNDIYIKDLADAFTFRIRAGNRIKEKVQRVIW